MRAVHWLRLRQEKQELTYWLSYAAYDTHDRSLSNRLYLVYLFIFFSIWLFVVLIFFAGGGAFLLNLINPEDPSMAAVFLTAIPLSVWWVISLWQALKRSPVVFSEEDAALVCQMPLNPRMVVLRWLVMPWIKSCIPFCLLAITLGFSLAETDLVSGAMSAERFWRYSRQGLQSFAMIIPIHLTLYVLTWSVGVWHLNKDKHLKPLALVLTAGTLVCLLCLMVLLAIPGDVLPKPLQPLKEVLIFPLKAGFDQADLDLALLFTWALAAISLLVLISLSAAFSPSRSAQETANLYTIKSLLRYGLTEEAQEMRLKKRLGVSRKAPWQPGWEGAAAMTWKDMLQFGRTFNWGDLVDIMLICNCMMGFLFLPDLSSSIFLIALWAMRITKVSTRRLRNDLSRWVVIKQLPIPGKHLIAYDLLFASGLVLLASLVGLTFGSLVSGKSLLATALLLPGMIAGVAGITAFDVIRRSRSSLLLRGQPPNVGALTIIAAALCTCIPVFIPTLVSGLPGVILSIAVSVLIGYLAYRMASSAYRYMDINEVS